MFIIVHISSNEESKQSVSFDIDDLNNYLKITDKVNITADDWDAIRLMDYTKFTIYDTDTKETTDVYGVDNLWKYRRRLFGVVQDTCSAHFFVTEPDDWDLLDYIDSPIKESPDFSGYEQVSLSVWENDGNKIIIAQA